MLSIAICILFNCLIIICRFICEDSIEERIELLQKKKLEIAQSVLTGVRQQNSNTLTIDDMKSLFGMR